MNEVWVVTSYSHGTWRTVGVGESRGMGKFLAEHDNKGPIDWKEGVRQSEGKGAAYDYTVRRHHVEVAEEMGG